MYVKGVEHTSTSCSHFWSQYILIVVACYDRQAVRGAVVSLLRIYQYSVAVLYVSVTCHLLHFAHSGFIDKCIYGINMLTMR